MRVAKWGNSLAVRLPVKMIAALGVGAGDELNVTVKGPGAIEIEAKRPVTAEKLSELLRPIRRPLPRAYRFDRDEANAR